MRKSLLVAFFAGLVASQSACVTQQQFRYGIDANIRKQRDSFRQCYESLARSEPDAYGQIRLKFTCDTDGKVTSSEVASSSFKNARFQECMMGVLRSIRFPSDKAPYDVIYPFELTRGL
ncbi:MAG: hypothetical protein EBX52_11305 [Proteobacteria bacterium]|nr:hypothetical protein [Pseudomonadota bacterium]